ncbi:MAG: SCO family protein [Gammaproteobacteria bacterium]|nr:SCO family protein [Gammaproteobacteria bacterium]
MSTAGGMTCRDEPMARRLLHRLSLLLFGACMLLAGGIPAATQQKVPDVVVSIKPLHALLAGLMRGVAEPRLLIGSDSVPWRYAPDDAAQQALRTADLVVWSGAELEPGLADAIAASDRAERAVEVLASAQMKVLPSRVDDSRRDPFYWLDTRNMMILLDELKRHLADIDPEHAALYERNRRRLAEALATLDRSLEFGYRDVSGVPVFFYHDTHRYFAQAYAMHLAGAAVEVSGGEIDDAARLLELRGALAAAGMACLFTEKGIDEPHLDLLTSAGEVNVVELDSLGSGLDAGEDLYVDLMRSNFATISHCVKRLKSTADRPGQDQQTAQESARFAPRFAMQDQYGRLVSHEDFPGRLQLIYFGYTFCPDVCPTSLAVMARALTLLGDQAEQVQPIFITVDPQRDTPELLGEYVKYFHPRMLGLSASPQVTRRTAELFRARYERVESNSGDPARYSMDHSASLFLLGRHGEFLTKFAHGLPAADVAARLSDYLQE